MVNITGVQQQVTTELEGWFGLLVDLLPNMVLAIILLAVGFFVAKKIRSVAMRSKHFGKNPAIKRLYAGTFSALIIIITLYLVLETLSLSKAVTSLLAGVGIIGLALGFAFQDIAANYISGVIIAIQQPFKKGDLIKTNDYFGNVEAVNLRSIQMQTLDGLDVIIPNKDVLQMPLTNYTHTTYRRVDLSVGISYGEDLEHVKKVSTGAIKKGRIKPFKTH